MLTCTGYAAAEAARPMAPWTFERRDTLPNDVKIKIQFCGVCHSDLHSVRAEWGNDKFPLVPGHEIIGQVVEVGAEVSRFTVGQTVGVGCMVDSCRTCASCREGLEQYCEQGFTGTYGNADRVDGRITQGGYSDAIVVDQAFVLTIPEGMDPAGAAPLLCAGITTYSPLKHWRVSEGQKVGVVGLGGLGHMALKLAHAMGAEVTLFTTSAGKSDDAKRLGATNVVVSKDTEAMKALGPTFDFIIDTVSATHDINSYLALLKRDGALVQVGAPPEPLATQVFSLIGKRRTFAGSLIGGIPETQEMLQFCAEHGIIADIEIIKIADIENAYERMLRSDVKYRFVIDMAGLAG